MLFPTAADEMVILFRHLSGCDRRERTVLSLPCAATGWPTGKLKESRCCLVSFHFLWAILRPHPILSQPLCRRFVGRLVNDGEIEMGLDSLEDRNRSFFLSFYIIPATNETPLKEDVARDFLSIYLPSQKRCYIHPNRLT